MTERPRWETVGDRLARITEELGDPFMIRDIQITFLEPDWAYGNGVFKAECQECGAYSTMCAHERSQLEYLAHVIEDYECPKQGHRQLESALNFMCSTGWANETGGDFTSPTGCFSRITNDPADIGELTHLFEGTGHVIADMRELVGHFLVVRSHDGGTTVTEYTTYKRLQREYRKLEVQFAAWQADNPTLFEADE